MKVVDAIIDLFFPPKEGDDRQPSKAGLLFFLVLLFILLWGTCR